MITIRIAKIHVLAFLFKNLTFYTEGGGVPKSVSLNSSEFVEKFLFLAESVLETSPVSRS